jgi:hypothetical protein
MPRIEDALEKETNVSPVATSPSAGEPSSIQAGPPSEQEQVDTLALVLGESRHSIYIQGLIKRLMDGSEPIEEDQKKYYHVDKFNAAHINMIMLKAAGFKNVEICDIIGLDKRNQGAVSTIIRHPYGQKLLQAMIPLTVGRAVDVKTRMTSYASQMLERLYDVGMNTKDEQVATRIGFGLLDRAGFGAVKQVSNTHKFSGPAESIRRLADALSESQQVKEVVAGNYTIRSLPEGGVVTDPPRSDAASRPREEDGPAPPINPLTGEENAA